MDSDTFREQAHKLVDWMADYLDEVENYPVKSQVEPREIFSSLPDKAPHEGESFDVLFKDFQDIILPGITHWQSPSFFAYFPANSSRISVLAEMLTATIGAQCMSWVTSPAATELEERVMEWLREMIGLPPVFQAGVIQDTASTATLCSLLTAREQVTNYSTNESGLYKQKQLIVYCSTETHSSIEKDVKIIGLGKENLRKIPVDDKYAMIPERLEEVIQQDLERGYQPMAVVVAIGTTGSTAIDPLKEICRIARIHNLWVHVDAALAGTALVLPHLRWMVEGVDQADSFVFNPHKWMFTNFDCSAYFVKDPEALVRTFEILPEYLKTKSQGVKNYRDWGVQLGRRFRALKLWWVIRSYGVRGIQEKVQLHLDLASWVRKQVEEDPEFELLAPTPLNTVSFRFCPPTVQDEDQLNQLNEELMERVNKTGKIYITHTKLANKFTLRFVVGQTEVQERHVVAGWELIRNTTSQMI